MVERLKYHLRANKLKRVTRGVYAVSPPGVSADRFQQTFYVPERVLERLVQHRSLSPHYLERDHRGASLVARWNLILPEALAGMEEPDER
jgi:hypothetical protein